MWGNNLKERDQEGVDFLRFEDKLYHSDAFTEMDFAKQPNMRLLMLSVIIDLLCVSQCIAGKVAARGDICRTDPIVLIDMAIRKKWASLKNFSKVWSDAEEKARKPAHMYMEKQHAVAIYTYTSSLLQYSTGKLQSVITVGRHQSRNETVYINTFLYSSLSDAVQVLKHSQVTCLSTYYRTQRLLHLNISNQQIRFGSFMLFFDNSSLESCLTCFEINTCFGADISHYSVMDQIHQVLIPPYEVFKVSRVHPVITKGCNITYKLESNLNCVYDIEGNRLHPISASPVEVLWCLVIITFMIIICLVVIIVKVYRKKTNLQSVYLHQSASYHGEVVMKTPLFNIK
uniref:T-cell ecto-ADP-ribosyltransferase 1-like n=1 Tax=Doryrhamphus excisus TaxID=161450 RepID=UPI0025AE9458|nr:T-cell ecto-ADP-ribosyltransferase 1-like [Doryrhamphus excisus]